MQVLPWEEALRYGLLGTLDQDVIFSKRSGVLGLEGDTGSDVKFFILEAPSPDREAICYRRPFGVHSPADDDDAESIEAANDVLDINPSRGGRCLKGVPFQRLGGKARKLLRITPQPRL